MYVITNPAWPGHCKLGRTANLKARLKVYQTSSPRRDFTVEYTRWFPNVYAAEQELKRRVSGFRRGGEWAIIHPADAIEVIEQIGG